MGRNGGYFEVAIDDTPAVMLAVDTTENGVRTAPVLAKAQGQSQFDSKLNFTA